MVNLRHRISVSKFNPELKFFFLSLSLYINLKINNVYHVAVLHHLYLINSLTIEKLIN